MPKLNIVYIGPLSFPLGFASTKRRRYIIDYMNEHRISVSVLCTRHKKNKLFDNPIEGKYGNTIYYNISDLFKLNSFANFYKVGKLKLKEWYNPNGKNILIFHTSLNIEDYPFFLFGKKMGYKIIFDQVETSYSASGTNASLKRKFYVFLCNWISDIAYKKAAGSFVISKALREQNRRTYPNMPLCLLPNSTPILLKKRKQSFSTPIKILYSGTFAPKDGVKFLIDGYFKAKDSGINCELILTGVGDEKDMAVLKLIEGKQNVKYLGLLSDDEIIRTMLECDILTMTRTNSKFANFGFPFKLSEYLSTGNVVLASKVSDVEDYLIDRVNAYLVDSENADSISDAIIDICKDPLRALEIGANGIEVARKYFSIDKIGNKMVDFIDNL